MEATASLSDFPDSLSPVFVRDIRQGLRSQVFVWSFLLLQLAALIVALAELLLVQAVGGDAFFGAGSAGLFALGLSFVFGLLLPLTSFGALRSELGPGRNIELLLAAGLTRWQLLGGKLMVAATLHGLLLVSLLPYLLLRYFLGNVELVGTLAIVASVFLGNVVANAIVIGASGFANYVGRAFVILFLLLLHLVSVSLASATWGSGPGGVGSLGTALSIISVGLVSALFVIFGLQVGRSRAKPFENPVDPPGSASVFILAFVTPFFEGVALAGGGKVAGIVTLVILLVLIALYDRGPDRKKRLKGRQP